MRSGRGRDPNNARRNGAMLGLTIGILLVALGARYRWERDKTKGPTGRYDGPTILSNDLKFSIGLRCATRDCVVFWPDGGSLIDTSPSCLALHAQQAKSCAKVARPH